MTAKWLELITGSLEEKKQFKAAQAQIDALPQPHRTAAKATQRYIMRTCAPEDGANFLRLTVDFADLWETSQSDGASVRDIIGDDPVEFAETFAASYAGKRWIDKERARLLASLEELDHQAIDGGEPS